MIRGERPAWFDDAACRNHVAMGRAWWWPPTIIDTWGRRAQEPRAARMERIARAKAVCAVCPVRRQCLAEVAPAIWHPKGWVAGGHELDRMGRPVDPRGRWAA